MVCRHNAICRLGLGTDEPTLAAVMGRPLTDAERRSYTHVDSPTRDRARIRSLPWLPGRFQGITLGRNVFLAIEQPDDGTSGLIAHELVHVEQWADRRVFGFLGWYLADFLRNLRIERHWMRAYRAVEAEREARRRTQAWVLTRR
ncbi:MAG: hypothetical protein HKN24_12475 [Acidimicrobiales bacterium]|nr:hypothetical protein [Acidimicrobiales bacterium]